MSKQIVGLVTGMTLGFAGYFGGFGAFLLVAGLGALGLILGGFLQGDLIVGDFVRRRGEDRRSRGDSRPQDARDDPGRQKEFRRSWNDFERPRGDFGLHRSRVQ